MEEEREVGASYEKVLTAVAREEVKRLLELYGGWDRRRWPWISAARFTDLNMDTDPGSKRNGRYFADDKRIELDQRYSDLLDLETGEVEPPLDHILTHESAHALQLQNNLHADTLLQHNFDTGDKEINYRKDVRNASLEMIARFEQFLETEPDDWPEAEAVEQAVYDPVTLPEFMSTYLDLDGEWSKDTIRNPYNLGYFTALSVYEGFRSQYREETALELTRDFLLNVVTSHDGLKGIIEQSFELRAVPNYPRMLSTYDDRFSEAAQTMGDFGVWRTADREAHRLLDEYDGTEWLAFYLEGNALFNAYDHRTSMEPPSYMWTLDAEITSLENRFAVA